MNVVIGSPSKLGVSTVYRTEKAELFFKGKAIWGKGQYFSATLEDCRKINAGTDSDIKAYKLKSSLRLMEFDLTWRKDPERSNRDYKSLHALIGKRPKDVDGFLIWSNSLQYAFSQVLLFHATESIIAQTKQEQQMNANIVKSIVARLATAKSTVVADVNTKDAAAVIVDVFRKRGLAVKANKAKNKDNYIAVTYKDPMSGRLEGFELSLENKKVIFDSMGSTSFNPDYYEYLMGAAKHTDIEFVKLSDTKSFFKWTDGISATKVAIENVMKELEAFSIKFSNAMEDLQILVIENRIQNEVDEEQMRLGSPPRPPRAR